MDIALPMGETAGQSLPSVPPVLGDFMRRVLVLRENADIILPVFSVFTLDVVAVLSLFAN